MSFLGPLTNFLLYLRGRASLDVEMDLDASKVERTDAGNRLYIRLRVTNQGPAVAKNAQVTVSDLRIREAPAKWRSIALMSPQLVWTSTRDSTRRETLATYPPRTVDLAALDTDRAWLQISPAPLSEVHVLERGASYCFSVTVSADNGEPTHRTRHFVFVIPHASGGAAEDRVDLLSGDMRVERCPGFW